MAGAQSSDLALKTYEPPALFELGTVAERTLHGGLDGCYWGKQFGGSDGFTFMGISVPISSCSS
jgi:hypothetical protein